MRAVVFQLPHECRAGTIEGIFMTQKEVAPRSISLIALVATLIALIVVATGGLFLQQVLAQATSGDVSARRAALEAELSGIEKEIEAQRVILAAKQRETVSLERDVSILDAQISEAQLSIRARNLSIQKLTGDIGTKNEIIDSLSEKTLREKESLAQLLRKTNELDSFSLVEVVLSNEDLSQFFIDLDSFDAIKASLQESFTIIEETKTATAAQRNALEEKKTEEVELRALQELQKQRVEDKRKERNKILAATKGQEKAYQKILDAKEQDAASIRAELFALRGSAAIPFGTALDLANKASAKTGVRAALILGVITQESNLGENTGQCLLKNPTTGSGIGKNTGRFFETVMKPTRDVQPFLDLAKRVGFAPFETPVSCPPSYGYGGAMGPAQFIPSTWILYEDRIGKLTGHNPPNPWDPEDAFMAAAVLLMDNGAAKSTSTCTLTNDPEECAALRYFAGWGNANKPAYRFYGQDVVDFANNKYQPLIDILQKG